MIHVYSSSVKQYTVWAQDGLIGLETLQLKSSIDVFAHDSI